MYFNDYSQEQQDNIFNSVMENIIKEQYPDYNGLAQFCNMSTEEWLHETTEDYINCNNRLNEFAEYLE